MAVLSPLSAFAQEGSKKIEDIIAKGDKAYVNNQVSEAARLYKQAHDLLPGANVSPDFKKAVDERYNKTLGSATVNAGANVGAVGPSSTATGYAYTVSSTGGIEQRAAARLDERTQRAMSLVSKARELYSEQKYEEALQEYKAAFDVIPNTPASEKRRQFIIDSMGDASIAVAQQYAKVGRYDEARALLESTLKNDPHNALAQKTLAMLDDPIRNNPAQTPQNVANVQEVNRLLNLGYGYYDLGKYDDAIKSFNSVLLIDKTNVAARRGMETANRRKLNYYEAAHDEMRGRAITEVESLWENVPSPDDLPDKLAGMLEDSEKSASKAIDEKIKTIIIPKIDLEGVDLMEAVEFVRRQASHLESDIDSAHRGVNITVNLGPPDGETAKRVLAKKFDLRMQEVPLREVIEYIAKQTGTIAYTTSYSVEISANADDAPMMTEVIPLPPGFFSAVDSDSSGADADPFADAASSGVTITRVNPKEALTKMGVSFPEGASVQYNSQNSTIVVRNTPQNIQFIREIASAKTSSNYQVVVSTTIISISEETLKELGFDWTVDLSFSPGKLFGIGGESTADAVASPPTPGGMTPLPSTGLVTAGLRTMSDVAPTNNIDSIIQNGTSASLSDQPNVYKPGTAPGFFSVRGIWSAADVSVVMRGLDQKKGVDLMQRPQVIVRVGEKATIFAGKELYYPEDYEAPQIPNSVGGNNNNGNGNNSNMMITPAHPTSFVKREIGTICDIDVTEIENNSVVHMNINPQFVEFDGFINYGSPVTMPMVGQNNNSGGLAGGDMYIDRVVLTKNEILKPVFSVKNARTSLNVISGQTVVIGGLKKAVTTKFEDKVPIFGDIPLVGRLFRSEGEQVQRTAMLMLIRADIIDPAGRDVRSATPVVTGDTLLSATSQTPQDISTPGADSSASDASELTPPSEEGNVSEQTSDDGDLSF